MGARVTNRNQLSAQKKNKKQRKKNNNQRVIIKGTTNPYYRNANMLQ